MTNFLNAWTWFIVCVILLPPLAFSVVFSLPYVIWWMK